MSKKKINRSQDSAHMKEHVEDLGFEIDRLKKILLDKEWAAAKTNDCIKILYKELESKNRQLEEFNLKKSEFVANVSHEFKNPVFIVLESVSLLLEGELGEVNSEQARFLKTSKRNLERLSRLVSDLLDLARIESGQTKLKKASCDFKEVLRDVISVNAIAFDRKELEVECDFPAVAVYADFDKDRIEQALVNLIDNAIKFSPEKSKIRIVLKDSAENLVFEIIDSGPGVPEEYKEKIFDKFERVTSERYEGTGLGLPIVKDVIELHQGKAFVHSVLGVGSTFGFILPKIIDDQRDFEI